EAASAVGPVLARRASEVNRFLAGASGYQATDLLTAAEVLAGARVNLDGVANGDERRNVDLHAGFEGGRLVLGCRRGALERRLGMLDEQFDRRRQFEADRLSLVEDGLRLVLFLEGLDLIADPLAVEVDLVVRLHVHEDVVLGLL